MNNSALTLRATAAWLLLASVSCAALIGCNDSPDPPRVRSNEELSFSPRRVAVGSEVIVTGTGWSDERVTLYLVPRARFPRLSRSLLESGELPVLTRTEPVEGAFSVTVSVPDTMESENRRDMLVVSPGEYSIGANTGHGLVAKGVLMIIE